MRSTRFPRAGIATSPTYDANGNLIGGDVNCATVCTPYQNYMWNGMIGLFLKMEQNNLYNEINFNLATTMPDNATAIRRTIDGFVCPSNRRPVTVARTRRNAVAQLGPSDYRGNMAAGMVIPSSTHQLPHARPDQSLLLASTTTASPTRTPRSTWPTSPTERPRRSSSARA